MQELHDDEPRRNWDRHEPVRSRMQIDLSKDARRKVRALADTLNMNPKQLVITAMIAQYPELADELADEIKRPGYTIKHMEIENDAKK